MCLLFRAGKCSSPSSFGVGVSPTFKAGAPVLPCASNVGAKKSVLLFLEPFLLHEYLYKQEPRRGPHGFLISSKSFTVLSFYNAAIPNIYTKRPKLNTDNPTTAVLIFLFNLYLSFVMFFILSKRGR